MGQSPLLIQLQNNRISISDTSSNSKSLLQEELCVPAAMPIVKWAGGKQWLAVAAKHLIPPSWKGRYYEPFLGGGAFFFALHPKLATLSDCNEELIEMYRTVSTDALGIIRLLRRYQYDEQFYYKIRDKAPRTARTRAARFLYLNRTCWNGLYRVNQQGRFNTPFGRFENPTICDSKRILTAARLLRRIKLRDGDFAVVVSDAQLGDFIYFDPPYITGHQNNGFLKYNSRLFSWSDQERLAELAIGLAKAGIYVLISNADQPMVINMYKGFHYYRTSRHSLIGGQITSRGITTEALLSNYPLMDCASVVI